MANIDIVTLALAKKYTDEQVILGSEISPSIRDGIWFIGEISTGVKAQPDDGLTPYIGENENWWIGNIDTGVRAEAKDTLFIGEGDMPEGYDMQIDPTGNILDIDKEAIENSENLITSGAVYAAMQAAKEEAEGSKEIFTGEGEPPEDAVFWINYDGEVVKYAPIEKTEDMTAPVGVDENGQLWCAGPEIGEVTPTAISYNDLEDKPFYELNIASATGIDAYTNLDQWFTLAESDNIELAQQIIDGNISVKYKVIYDDNEGWILEGESNGEDIGNYYANLSFRTTIVDNKALYEVYISHGFDGVREGHIVDISIKITSTLDNKFISQDTWNKVQEKIDDSINNIDLGEINISWSDLQDKPFYQNTLYDKYYIYVKNEVDENKQILVYEGPYVDLSYYIKTIEFVYAGRPEESIPEGALKGVYTANVGSNSIYFNDEEYINFLLQVVNYDNGNSQIYIDFSHLTEDTYNYIEYICIKAEMLQTISTTFLPMESINADATEIAQQEIEKYHNDIRNQPFYIEHYFIKDNAFNDKLELTTNYLFPSDEGLYDASKIIKFEDKKTNKTYCFVDAYTNTVKCGDFGEIYFSRSAIMAGTPYQEETIYISASEGFFDKVTGATVSVCSINAISNEFISEQTWDQIQAMVDDAKGFSFRGIVTSLPVNDNYVGDIVILKYSYSDVFDTYIFTENGWHPLRKSVLDDIYDYTPDENEIAHDYGEALPTVEAVYNFVKQEIENIDIPSTPSYEIGEGLKLVDNTLSIDRSQTSVYGTVDENHNITLLTSLPFGTYNIRYEGAEGYQNIGSYTITSDDVDNMLARSVAPYDITQGFDTHGYKNGTYVSTPAPWYGVDTTTFCTGLMPIPTDRIVYVKGADFDTSVSHVRLGLFEFTSNNQESGFVASGTFETMSKYVTLEKLNDLYFKLTFNEESQWVTNGYFYFSTLGTGDNVLVSAYPFE